MIDTCYEEQKLRISRKIAEKSCKIPLAPKIY